MRPIDADELKKAIELLCEDERTNMTAIAYFALRELVDTMPTIEAAPVKHGKWETWGYIFHGIAWKRCSVCGKTADVSYQALLDGKIEMATPSICGCCGCRMDGDNDD